jgi:hypothetical protein
MPTPTRRRCGFENGYAAIAPITAGPTGRTRLRRCCVTPTRSTALPAAVLPTLESHIYVADTTEGRKLRRQPLFPHGRHERASSCPTSRGRTSATCRTTRCASCKLVNGEIDYKSQSLTLARRADACWMGPKGDYTIELRPQIGLPSLSFNVNAPDPAKREVFADRDFRVAMSTRSTATRSTRSRSSIRVSLSNTAFSIRPRPSSTRADHLRHGVRPRDRQRDAGRDRHDRQRRRRRSAN